MLRLINLSAGGKVTKCQTYFGVKKLFTYFAVLGMLAICNLITAHAAERCPNTSPKGSEDSTKPFATISISSKAVKLFTGKTIVEPFGSTVQQIAFESLINPLGSKVYTKAKITKADISNCLLSIKKLKDLALKTVEPERLYLVFGSTISEWDGAKDLSNEIIDAGLARQVHHLSPNDEAKFSLLSITTDSRQVNDSVFLDVGSGKIKISTGFINAVKKNGMMDIQSLSLDGLTTIASSARKMGDSKFNESLENYAKGFSTDLNDHIEATPAFDRKIIVMNGGLMYAFAVHQNCDLSQRFVAVTPRMFDKFIKSAEEATSMGELFGSESDVPNTFTIHQCKAGAMILKEITKSLKFEAKELFLALNTPQWELILGSTLASKTGK